MIDRYKDDYIEEIWSDRFKWCTAVLYEIAVLKVVLTKHDITVNIDDLMENTFRLLLNDDTVRNFIDKISIEEIKTQHDVVAFVNVLDEMLSYYIKPVHRYLHWGLTSSDVTDTVQEFQMMLSQEHILDKITKLQAMIEATMVANQKCVMPGRTHGVHGAYTTLTHKLFKYVAILNEVELALSKDYSVFYFKAGGPMGCREFVTRDMEVKARIEFEELLLEQHGYPIHEFEVWDGADQVIPRQIISCRLNDLMEVSSIIAQLAMEIRHLHRTEVAEVLEARPAGSSGSSSMPHKQNPIACEKICGLHRLMKSYAMAAIDNTQLWHERDISHSSVERVILNDAYGTLAHMLSLMTNVMETLVVDTERIKHNVEEYCNSAGHWSYYMLNLLVKHGFDRQAAYIFVRDKMPDEINQWTSLWLAIDQSELRDSFTANGTDIRRFVLDLRDHVMDNVALLADEEKIMQDLL